MILKCFNMRLSGAGQQNELINMCWNELPLFIHQLKVNSESRVACCIHICAREEPWGGWQYSHLRTTLNGEEDKITPIIVHADGTPVAGLNNTNRRSSRIYTDSHADSILDSIQILMHLHREGSWYKYVAKWFRCRKTLSITPHSNHSVASFIFQWSKE
jgi:hypothetical protein